MNKISKQILLKTFSFPSFSIILTICNEANFCSSFFIFVSIFSFSLNINKVCLLIKEEEIIYLIFFIYLCNRALAANLNKLKHELNRLLRPLTLQKLFIKNILILFF
jgi:hypothetical protein